MLSAMRVTTINNSIEVTRAIPRCPRRVQRFEFLTS
jgi:hypothetical protein